MKREKVRRWLHTSAVLLSLKEVRCGVTRNRIRRKLRTRNRRIGKRISRQSPLRPLGREQPDRKSTRLNSSHLVISYAVFCLKKKNSIWNIDAARYSTAQG